MEEEDEVEFPEELEERPEMLGDPSSSLDCNDVPPSKEVGLCEEVLPPLSETYADILSIDNEAFLPKWFSFVPPRAQYTALFIDWNEEDHRLPSFVPRNQYGQLDYTNLKRCRINQSGRSALLYAAVPDPIKFITQCSGIRDRYTSCVRYISFHSRWWLPSALGFVVDCREFIATYGLENTPLDVVESFDEIEKRLFTQTGFAGERLDYSSPTGAYAVLFGSADAARDSFSFGKAQFCFCEDCMLQPYPCLEVEVVLEIRNALDPTTSAERREKAKRIIQQSMGSRATASTTSKDRSVDDPVLYEIMSRPWNVSDEVSSEHSLEDVFKKSGMHVVHWYCAHKNAYEHALLVGPLERQMYVPTMQHFSEIGCYDAYMLARNDLINRRFRK